MREDLMEDAKEIHITSISEAERIAQDIVKTTMYERYWDDFETGVQDFTEDIAEEIDKILGTIVDAREITIGGERMILRRIPPLI